MQHKNSVKDMINIDPPKFRMNMTDHQWREEKLQWERYNIKNPPGSPAMRFEMMKRSMSRELSEVMDNYMKKMGPYCSGCSYDAADKTGDNSCPLNSLYWHFHVRNRAKLERNPRMGMAYRPWDKMPAEKQEALLERGDAVLANLENL